MSEKRSFSFWRFLRVTFRWCRILVWLLVLLIVVSGIYFNRVGVPDFVKTRILAQLRQEGFEAQFSRMRLRWYRGLVIEDATLTRTNRVRFSSPETVVNLDWSALQKSIFKLDSLSVTDGTFSWPVTKSNTLVLTNIQTRIRFASSNVMEVQEFKTELLGSQIKVHGALTNFASAQGWKLFHSEHKKGSGKGRVNSVDRLLDVLDQFQFSSPPGIDLFVAGDASDVDSIQSHLEFAVPSAASRWGHFQDLKLRATLNERTIDNRLDIHLTAAAARSEWGQFRNLKFHTQTLLAENPTNVVRLRTLLSAENLSSQWQAEGMTNSARCTNLFWTGNVSVNLSNQAPTELDGKLNAFGVSLNYLGKPFSARGLDLALQSNKRGPEKAAYSAELGPWKSFTPLVVSWNAKAIRVATPWLALEKVATIGDWNFPLLQLKKIDATVFDGSLSASGDLDVNSRHLSVKARSDFNIHKLAPILPVQANRFLDKYTWEQSPQVKIEATAQLPSWTNRAPDWNAEIVPTLHLNGQAAVSNATYRAMAASYARTTFQFENFVWTLPDLHVERPEGNIELTLKSDNRDGTFLWTLDSHLFPDLVRPLLQKTELQFFELLKFSQPPHVMGEISGNWGELETLRASGQIQVTNFVYRTNHVDTLTTAFVYTNANLRLTNSHLTRLDKQITATAVAIDFPTAHVFFTNVYSTMDPMLVTRAIGRKVAAAVAPYHFATPPTVYLNGMVNATNSEDASMHFLVKGGPFKWEWFKADTVAAQVDWNNATLSITNVTTSAYGGGTVAGWAWFDFAHNNFFKFDMAAADVDLHKFFTSIEAKNSMQGKLHASLTVTSATTKDLHSWNGYGKLNLRDGFLWDTPIFGVFSKPLDAIAPGVGKSRAREASGTFTITNSVIHSDDLEIRASAVRLQYRGDVDFDRNVNARVEAEVLRDAWFIGRFVSLALTPLSKLFEYKVTGNLGNPQTEPLYIPKVFMMMLRPFHSLKNALPADSNASAPEGEKQKPNK